MRKILLLALPFLLSAEGLKELLEHAQKSNELIVSKGIASEAKMSEVTSSKSSYFPTVDVGAFYQRYDEASPFSPTATYSGFATVGFDVYSGGEKSNKLQQKKEEYRSSQYEYEATKKDISLSIVEDFYNYKTLQAKLDARLEASKAVEAQLHRMQRFYDAALATNDDVDRLQSAYDNNIYNIESIKFEMLKVKKSLELKVGKKIEHLDTSSFVKDSVAITDELDSIKALRAQKSAALSAAETIDSYYYPQIRVEDTYSFYGYEEIPSIMGAALDLPTEQNKLMATLNLRLFDFGAIGESKEAVMLSANALGEQIRYQNKEQKMQQELALERIETAKLNIQSASSALRAANSALKTITKKYNNGIVDNVVYLDALSSQTESKSTYEASLNNLELAYALYYYYNSQKLEEFLQ
ncbi:MAG: TolC family protein [Campylobacterales bacterium]|nr:TolC family protein [Campylobacterales bacterium]